MSSGDAEQRPAAVARGYFDALARRDAAAMVDHWQPGGIDAIAAVGELRAPEEVREFFSQLFAAVPDFALQGETRLLGDGERVAVQWQGGGTFAGAPLLGVQPTGRPIRLQGVDVLVVREGRIVRNDAYLDGAELARQLGVLPAADSAGERLARAAANLRTRVRRALTAIAVEQVAEGVWVARGGTPKNMNVYLLRDGEGVAMFDAGIADMTDELAAECARRGGLTRIVLGHSHADHRGAAAGLEAPVYCHPDEAADAEGDGGAHSFRYEQINLAPARWAYPHLLSHWDGGPVAVAGTVSEGDPMAGFEVVELPGHAPGQIGLWRERDRLALASDCFYTLDPETGRHGGARVPHPAFTPDRPRARESLRKLAALEPRQAWPGHAEPVREEVRRTLEAAVDEDERRSPERA